MESLTKDITGGFYYGSAEISPGIWTVYPDLDKQHLEIIGVTAFNPIWTRQFYCCLMQDIAQTAPVTAHNVCP